ncbi:uncharacterized protein LOC122548164, partial [Chiloscyllium plagiosum]|uniref:uncharacterized protein LOC122548164 n=1 Tax=Chiloscyllium plagiosum TaxID=36176 RepID=UPI001CB85B09
MDKSSPPFESCCLRVTQQEVKPGHFNRFQKSYRKVQECGTSQAAVLFSLKKGGIMCVDPQMSWVKELMRRIDKVAPKSGADKANDPSGHVGDRYQTKGPTLVRQRTGTTPANQEDPDATPWRPTWAGSSETSAIPHPVEESALPGSEAAAGTDPPSLQGALHGVSETLELGSSVPTPTRSIPGESADRHGSEVTRPEVPPPSAGSPPGMVTAKGGSDPRVVEETVESSGRVGPERARRKELGRSEVALLALLPIVLVLVSVIAYLLCKRRPRNGEGVRAGVGVGVGFSEGGGEIYPGLLNRLSPPPIPLPQPHRPFAPAKLSRGLSLLTSRSLGDAGGMCGLGCGGEGGVLSSASVALRPVSPQDGIPKAPVPIDADKVPGGRGSK